MSARGVPMALAALVMAGAMLMLGTGRAHAQGNAPPTFSSGGTANPPPAPPPLVTPAAPAPANNNFLPLSIIAQALIIGFGAFVMVLEYRYLIKSNKVTDHALQFFGITLIVIATLYLVTILGDTTTFASGTFGLFGSIAGYLFGRGSRPAEAPPAGEEAGGEAAGAAPGSTTPVGS